MNPWGRPSLGVPFSFSVPFPARNLAGQLLRSLFSFVRVSFVAVPLALIGACGSSESALTASDQSGGANEDLPAEDPKTSFSDASTAASPVATGPCGAESKCMPDNDGRMNDNCATSPDAGVAPGDFMGCRIEEDAPDAGTFSPRCVSANADGTDGASCARGSDCAPGFDCVEEEETPVCRRYCCSGSCEGQLSQNGGKTFCDVRKLANRDQHLIPVCMPIKTCKLLRAGECSETETCGIVTENGSTGCVPKGDARVDEKCDDRHCDSNLTCLGVPGERRCFQLCRVDSSDCPPTRTCTTSSVFQDTSFGVCKE